MKHWSWCVAMTVACALAAACHLPAPLSDQDKAAIQKNFDEYARQVTADKADHAAIVKSYLTDDARMLPPGAPAVEGRDAILKLYGSRGHYKSYKFGPLRIEGEGGLAYVESTHLYNFVPEGGLEPIVGRGRDITIWKKQEDGSWKLAADIWNSEAPSGLVLSEGTPKADASAELRQLDWFAGKWEIDIDKKASPFGPAGTFTYTMDCRWFAGGNQLACTIDGTTPAGPYHEVMFYSYDADAKAYRGFDNDSDGLSSPFALAYGNEGWTYTFDLRKDGKPAKLRMRLTDLTTDGCTLEQESSISGGPFSVFAEGKCRRLPG